MLDDFDNEDDLDQSKTEVAVEKPSPAAVLAGEVFKACVPAAILRTLLQGGKGVAVLLHAPDEKWASLFNTYLPRHTKGPRYVAFIETPRTSKNSGDASIIRALATGQNLVVISHDPATLVPSVVCRAADETVTVGVPPLDAVRTTIRRVTGKTVRGLKVADYAGLDLDLFLSCVRADESPATIIGRLRAMAARPVSTGTSVVPVPSLEQLPLTQVVRRWSDQMIEEMAAVKLGTLDPAALVYATLEGPPGTGKTLIGRSLAHTAGWNFVGSSVGSWFTVGDGALGGVARNLKEFIDAVLVAEPAVGFLDEIDAIPDRASMDNRGRDWWTPVVTLILTEIDRLRGSGRKILLLGATNHFQHLDAALIRAGRLQQRVSVLPPSTETEVLALFNHYVGDDLAEAEKTKLARVAIDATPAAIEGWVKSARAAARTAGRPLSATDLLDQMAPADERSPADLRVAALHELGHAIVAAELGYAVETISIVAGAGTGGLTSTRSSTVVPTLAQVRDRVTIGLGGRAADIVLGAGPNVGAESDLATTTELLLAARQSQGLGDTLAVLPPGATASLMSSVDAELKQLLERAMVIVRRHRHALLALAEELLAERILSGHAVAALIQKKAIGKKVALESSRDEGVVPGSPPNGQV